MSLDGPRRAAGDRLRIGVLGAAGQIGRCLVREVEAVPDLELAFGVTRAEFDLVDTDAIEPWLARKGAVRPDVVVNAAGFTKVDACESQPSLANQLNARVPGEWARLLRRRGIRFVHLSTDHVFPGDGTRPYREDDETGPCSVYGASKLEGERLVLGHDPSALVVRTAWVFGPGRNFVLAILEQAAVRRAQVNASPLQVVDDQWGSPTSAADLAQALVALCRMVADERPDVRGFLHLCNAGVTSRWEFARAILDQAGYADVAIDPVATGVFEAAAPRPTYSVLDCSRALSLGVGLRPWTEALAGYLAGPDRPTHLLAASPAIGASGREPATADSPSQESSDSSHEESIHSSSDPVRRKVSH